MNATRYWLIVAAFCFGAGLVEVATGGNGLFSLAIGTSAVGVAGLAHLVEE